MQSVAVLRRRRRDHLPSDRCRQHCQAITDEERTIMSIVSWPPGLAVGHQCAVRSFFKPIIVNRFECLGIVEILAHRVWRLAALSVSISTGICLGHQSLDSGVPEAHATPPSKPIGHPSILAPGVFMSMRISPLWIATRHESRRLSNENIIQI